MSVELLNEPYLVGPSGYQDKPNTHAHAQDRKDDGIQSRRIHERRPAASLGTRTFSSPLARSQGLGNSCSLLAPGPEKVIVWQKQEAA